MCDQELRKSCMEKCGRLLGSRDYSVQRLRMKLEAAGFPEEVISDAVEKLQKAGYLDDLRYAQNYIRFHLEDKSLRRIEQDLLDRGIDREWIGKAFALEGEEQDLREAQRRQILRLLEKRGFRSDEADFSQRQKQMNFLHRKGYPTDLIREAMG